MKLTQAALDGMARAEREGRVRDTTPARRTDPPAAPPGPHKPKRKAKAKPAPAQPMSWAIELTVPCRVVSEMNRRDHWTARRKRFKEQGEAIWAARVNAPMVSLWWLAKCNRHLVVTLTHIGRRMDSHDNLRAAFKGIVDYLAELLGVDDGDSRVTWRYEQRPGPGGVVVRIEPGEVR